MTITERYYKHLKDTIPGWMVEEKMQMFEQLYSEIRPQKAVEIGSFFGLSAIAQGIIIRELGIDCKLYAVDAYSKVASSEGSNSVENREWWNKLDYSKALDTFENSIKEHKLQDIVFSVVGKSDEVEEKLPPLIDIFHQDGNHAFEIVSKEIDIYAPKMNFGGYWIGDDYKWKEMMGATNKLVSEKGFRLIHEHDKDGQSFAVYKR